MQQVGHLIGARERVSAVLSSLPGTCVMLKENRISRSLNRCTRIGTVSSPFVDSKGTRGLWSVSTEKDVPSSLETYRTTTSEAEPPSLSQRNAAPSPSSFLRRTQSVEGFRLAASVSVLSLICTKMRLQKGSFPC